MNNNIIKNILEKELQEKNLIYPFVRDLNQQEKAVLSFRQEPNSKTLDFIGKKLGGITRERVRQIEAKAKAKLEYQKQIVARFSRVLSDALFTEREVEQAFMKFNKSKWRYPTLKLECQRFTKILWKQKVGEN